MEHVFLILSSFSCLKRHVGTVVRSHGITAGATDSIFQHIFPTIITRQLKHYTLGLIFTRDISQDDVILAVHQYPVPIDLTRMVGAVIALHAAKTST